VIAWDQRGHLGTTTRVQLLAARREPQLVAKPDPGPDLRKHCEHRPTPTRTGPVPVTIAHRGRAADALRESACANERPMWTPPLMPGIAEHWHPGAPTRVGRRRAPGHPEHSEALDRYAERAPRPRSRIGSPQSTQPVSAWQGFNRVYRVVPKGNAGDVPSHPGRQSPE
jgi:hypothetical protein